MQVCCTKLPGDSGHYPRNLDREYDRDHLNRGHASASTTTGYDSNIDEQLIHHACIQRMSYVQSFMPGCISKQGPQRDDRETCPPNRFLFIVSKINVFVKIRVLAILEGVR